MQYLQLLAIVSAAVTPAYAACWVESGATFCQVTILMLRNSFSNIIANLALNRAPLRKIPGT